MSCPLDPCSYPCMLPVIVTCCRIHSSAYDGTERYGDFSEISSFKGLNDDKRQVPQDSWIVLH